MERKPRLQVVKASLKLRNEKIMKINRTTLRATQILKLLAASPDGLTISEISEELNLPKTSAFDIVQTLNHAHFLRESNKRFFIGHMAHEVGAAYAWDKALYGAAKPHIIELAESMKMAGSLVTMEKSGLDYVIEYVPEGAIITPAASSGKNFMHASASGKVIISHMSEAKKRKLLGDLSFTAFTDRTIQNLAEFKEELEVTKKRGFGVDNREWHELVTCVAVPVFNRKKVVAAITLSGLQVDQDSIQGIAGRLKEKAKLIANEIA